MPLDVLKAVLAEEKPSGAYYYGTADPNVLRLLVESLPQGAVQAMVLGCEPYDDEKRAFLRRGVMFWSEGGHAAELVVRDYRWVSRDQLIKAVQWSYRLPPRLYLLAGEAAQVERHVDYTWEEREGCLIGRQKSPNPVYWRSQERFRKSRYEHATQLADRPDWRSRASNTQ